MTVITAAFNAAAPSTGKSTEGRGFRFDSIAEAAQRAVRCQRGTDAGDQVFKGAGPAGSGLDDNLQLGPVLLVKAQR